MAFRSISIRDKQAFKEEAEDLRKDPQLGSIMLGDTEYPHGPANKTNLGGLSVGEKMIISTECIPKDTDAAFSQTGIDLIFANDYRLVGKASGCWANSLNKTVPESSSDKTPGNKLMIERTKISEPVKAMYCQVNGDSPVCAPAPGADDTGNVESVLTDEADEADESDEADATISTTSDKEDTEDTEDDISPALTTVIIILFALLGSGFLLFLMMS